MSQPLNELFKFATDKQLLAARTIFLSEAVTSDTAKQVVGDLLVLDSQSAEPIYLYLNSPGGEVTSGMAIYDTIRFLRSPVTVITAGLCASN
jgi:ATP-dependent Clp protease, protease subunit